MIVAIASGKGGAGKTTLAAALALCAEEELTVVDCDVEEPNLALFLHPDISQVTEITVLVPQLKEEFCNGCGECRTICRFNALAVLKNSVMIFPELCHSCGGCILVCPRQALEEIPRRIGEIRNGRTGKISFQEGRLDIGRPMAPPLIREMMKRTQRKTALIIDAPPGSSCSFTTAVREASVVILVAEPTPFGLNDMQLAAEALKRMKIPFVVAANRVREDENILEDWCRKENIKIALRIPEERSIAEAGSRGEALPVSHPDLRQSFSRLWLELKKEYGNE